MSSDARSCPRCGTPAGPGHRFCLECGQLLPEPVIAPVSIRPSLFERIPLSTTEASPTRRTSVTRIIATFAVVGAGLGVGTMLFLWVVGFFRAGPGLDDIGQLFVGGIAIAGVLVFGLLIGVVLAAVGGMQIARSVVERSSAATSGAVAGGVGHLALVVVLGAILLLGFALADATRGSDEPTPSATTSEKEQCEQIFGAGSQSCANESTLPITPSPDPFSSSDDETDLDLADVLKLALGVIPATFVGALSAAIHAGGRA